MHFGSGVSSVPPLLIDRPKQYDLHQLSRFQSSFFGPLSGYANVGEKGGKSKCY